MKIKEILCALERFAPLPLQDSYDNAGLQVGLTEVEATGALLCLDVTEKVIDEAINLGFNLIISHHPLLFKGYKSITGKDYIERCIIKAIKNDITLYSAHTNIDNAYNGVSFKMAEKLKLNNLNVLEPKENSLLKFVTFVPDKNADEVRDALFEVGCGWIGNYDSCCYNIKGKGTFRALKGSNPYCGSIDELHHENEVRIETIIPSYLKNDVRSKLISVHPYEEPAYDFYPLLNEWGKSGAGVVGEFKDAMKKDDFLRLVKDTFKVGCLKYNDTTNEMIKSVALCGGSGAFLANKAVGVADAFITGEMKYHDYFNFENEILITEIGHYESEQYTKELFYSIIREAYPSLHLLVSKINTNPIKYL